MARIRSVHPGLFTDEAFMSCSTKARLLIIGLWVEADDQGVFEWKPVTLKARIFPADSFGVEELLEELEAQNIIKKFQHENKSYGAIRNFRKYQRPKSPNHKYFIPSNFRNYVGLIDEDSEKESDKDPSIPKQYGSTSENSFQREDVGCKREEIKKKKDGHERKDEKRALDPHPADSVIAFNYVTKQFEGITDEIISEWREAFPDIDINQHLKIIREWCISNPQKVKPRQGKGRKGLRRTIVNWLKSEQEKVNSSRNFHKAKLEASQKSEPKTYYDRKAYEQAKERGETNIRYGGS